MLQIVIHLFGHPFMVKGKSIQYLQVHFGLHLLQSKPDLKDVYEKQKQCHWNVSELSPQFFVRYMNYKKYSLNLIFLTENPKTYITTFLIHVQVSQDGVCSTRYRSVRLLLLVVVVSMAPKKNPPSKLQCHHKCQGTHVWNKVLGQLRCP